MTDSEYIIQKAAREHLPGLAAIEVAAAATFPPGYLPAGTEAEVMPLSIFQEAWANGRLWVSLNQGRPVGFAQVELDDGLIILAEVDVLPAHQGRGQGRGLIQRAIDYAAELGQPLYLTTFADLPWNAPFYARLGFVAVSVDQAPEQLRRALDEEYAQGFKNRLIMVYPAPV